VSSERITSWPTKECPHFTGKREEIVIAVFLNGQNQRLGEKDISVEKT
jgi:hypothetical protein